MASPALRAAVSSASNATATAKTGAEVLAGTELDVLALDFTDKSVKVIDRVTPANDLNESGSTPVGNGGALQGPDGFITYTAPSAKMVQDSAGTLTYAPHNLIGDSEKFVSWSGLDGATRADNQQVAPDGTTTGATLTADNDVGAHIVFEVATGVASGQVYEFSCYMKAGTTTFSH